jgi:polyisoprenoid-binding protein YceI
MKKLLYPFAAAALIVTSAFTFIASQDYTVAKDAVVKFTSADPTGTFSSIKGNITFDEANFTAAKFNITIDVNSINTGNGMRDKKALTEEWFNEPKFKTITFVSSKVEKSGDAYKISGPLKMKGVTKDYTMFAKFAKAGNGGKFTGNFNVSRKDFGVGKPSDVVPDIMKINFTVPVTQN